MIRNAATFRVLAALRFARILTMEFDARQMRTAFRVRFALVSAACQRRSVVAGQTFTSRYVVDNLADGIRTARTRSTQFSCVKKKSCIIHVYVLGYVSRTRIEVSARRERIAGVTGRTGTDRNMIARLAVGVSSANTLARIHADAVPASLVSSTFRTVQTFGPFAVRQWVAVVARRTGTDGTTAHDGTVRVLPARSALACRRRRRRCETRRRLISISRTRRRSLIQNKIYFIVFFFAIKTFVVVFGGLQRRPAVFVRKINVSLVQLMRVPVRFLPVLVAVAANSRIIGTVIGRIRKYTILSVPNLT